VVVVMRLAQFAGISTTGNPRVCTRAAGGIRDGSTAVWDEWGRTGAEWPPGKGSSALSAVAQLAKGG
jgi:hypothetical protein